VASVSKDRLYTQNFLIKAVWNNQFNFIRLSPDIKWNQSTFDTGGMNQSSGAQVFMYTDRGVYRPGSAIHLSVIARDQGDPVPDGLPAKLRVFNPKNQLVYDFQNTEARDGFYAFKIQTKESDLTGNW